jgi:hypothetical protein
MSLTRTFASLVSTIAVNAHDTPSEVSPVELPGRRLTLGAAVLVEARDRSWGEVRIEGPSRAQAMNRDPVGPSCTGSSGGSQPSG